MKNDSGPGVPEALPRTLRMVADRLGIERVDRLWIFPPLVRGRKEWGLVVASVYVEAEPESDTLARRFLHSAPYTAERTGQGLSLVHDLHEQGEAPPDRLPRMMDAVARRAGDDLGEPREVVLEGRLESFEALMKEMDPAPLEPTAS